MKLVGLAIRLSAASAASTTMGDLQATAALCEASHESCLTAKESFDRVAKGSGVELEWREATGLPTEVIAAEAGCADLLVLGRDIDDPDGAPYDVLPADVVMACGTPVMVLPTQPAANYEARRILLAWKSTAQAARAARDALPLLKRAQAVHLTEIVSESEAPRYGISVESMAGFLRSHGITVSVHRIGAAGDAGEQLMQAAHDNACDLIVAGAYGHSRFREWALGGVTRSLLVASTLPCLLSH